MAGAGGSKGPDSGRYLATTWTLLGAAFLAALMLVFAVRCPLGPDASREYPSRTLPPDLEPVLVAPAPPSEDYYPCSDCHEDEPTDPTPRELEDDHEIGELAHGTLWCLHCHDADDRDQLRLSDATRVEWEDSWRLCTQCHGQRLEEWRRGVHGKRTGHWHGSKEYQPCVSCHDPHAPRFQQLEPMPPPRRPTEAVRPDAGAAAEGVSVETP